MMIVHQIRRNCKQPRTTVRVYSFFRAGSEGKTVTAAQLVIDTAGGMPYNQSKPWGTFAVFEEGFYYV